MPKELIERYNHLNYNDQPEGADGFVDFLYENSNIQAPEVDVDRAWSSFEKQLVAPTKTKSYTWLKVAASVVVLVGVAFYLWTSSAPEELNIATIDEKMNVTFPDGSTGILNKNSSFTFLEKFGDERYVTFTGEAYFDIKKSSKPFVINAGNVEVRVLGTAFNLVKSDSEVELYVERGLVAFEKDGESTKVKAGLKAVFDKSTGEVSIIENPSVNITSWNTGILEFNDTPMTQVAEDLQEFYNTEVAFDNTRIGNCHLTITFEKTPLSQVARDLESVLGVSVDVQENRIVISGEGC